MKHFNIVAHFFINKYIFYLPLYEFDDQFNLWILVSNYLEMITYLVLVMLREISDVSQTEQALYLY